MLSAIQQVRSLQATLATPGATVFTKTVISTILSEIEDVTMMKIEVSIIVRVGVIVAVHRHNFISPLCIDFFLFRDIILSKSKL